MSGAARFFTETTPEHWLLVALELGPEVLVASEKMEVTVPGPVADDPESKE
jgi:hypothetical protein